MIEEILKFEKVEVHYIRISKNVFIEKSKFLRLTRIVNNKVRFHQNLWFIHSILIMSKGKSIDLDAILDDAVASEQLGVNKADPDVESTLKIRIVSDDVKPWIAATANVPQKDVRDKWTKMVKADTNTEIASKFQASYALRSWDAPTPVKNGINRSLQEIVKKAAHQCELDEQKITRLLTLVNPVTDSENGKQLQNAFARQLLTDLSSDILADPNYDDKRFTALAHHLAK